MSASENKLPNDPIQQAYAAGYLSCMGKFEIDTGVYTADGDLWCANIPGEAAEYSRSHPLQSKDSPSREMLEAAYTEGFREAMSEYDIDTGQQKSEDDEGPWSANIPGYAKRYADAALESIKQAQDDACRCDTADCDHSDLGTCKACGCTTPNEPNRLAGSLCDRHRSAVNSCENCR